MSNVENFKDIKSIKGGIARDSRGQIRFVNDFDMTLVKRFYIIKNLDTTLVRGWRGHRVEQRWFYILNGSFSIDLIKIDNWENATPTLPIQQIKLDVNDMSILNVPAGYATAFKALDSDSELLVFADSPVVNAVLDDYTWPLEYFKNFT